MARPPKLTPHQWAEVTRRVLQGESASALGREFGVSESAIRKRVAGAPGQSISGESAKVRAAAEKLADAENTLRALQPAQRVVAIDLAEKLRSISQSLANAAELGARTAHRLHALANSEVEKVDDADPLSEDSITALKGVGVLTKLANDSASTALNLLAANKETVKRMHEGDEDPSRPLADVPTEQLRAAVERLGR